MAQSSLQDKADEIGTEVLDGPPKKADPLDDPANVRKLKATVDFLQQLMKGIKQIGLYRHATSKYLEFVDKPHKALSALLDEMGALSWKVETQWFTLFGQDLLAQVEPGDNMPYKFYKDGIRHLIFRQGITIDELLQFTLIAVSDVKRGDDDILSQMWAANFQHIEYVVVEGFTVGEMSEEEVQIEVDKIVGYLYNRLRSNSEDYLRFARVDAQDLDLKLEGVDQIRGAVISGETADDELKRRVRDELREDMELRLYSKLVMVLFAVVESGTLSDVSEIKDTFTQVLDALLLQGDFATVNQIIVKLRAMERNSTLSGMAQQLRNFMLAKMGESQRLHRIGEILRSERPKNAPDIFRYLISLEGISVDAVLDILEAVEVPENRALLCDVLSALGKDDPEPFVKRLSTEKSQSVRDMLYVIDKCDFPDKLKIFANTLKSQNLAVKLEALAIITKGKSEGSRKLVMDAINDPLPQIRLGAAKALGNYDREKAMVELMRILKSPEWEKKDATEKAGFYAALGGTNLPGALTHMQLILGQKSNIFSKKKVVDEKLLAIKGLEAAQSLIAFKMLQQCFDEKSTEAELKGPLSRAMFSVKKALFGDPNLAPPELGKS